jgi:hypothetical protein
MEHFDAHAKMVKAFVYFRLDVCKFSSIRFYSFTSVIKYFRLDDFLFSSRRLDRFVLMIIYHELDELIRAKL